jgi:purine-nucleoside phosphorylase
LRSSLCLSLYLFPRKKAFPHTVNSGHSADSPIGQRAVTGEEHCFVRVPTDRGFDPVVTTLLNPFHASGDNGRIMQSAVDTIRAKCSLTPQVGVVLGSGLGAFASSLGEAGRIPYAELPGLPTSTAIGHAGELVLGKIAGTAVAVMSGRFHLYEGYTAQQTAAGIRLFHALGIKRVVLTNASGSINPQLQRGSLVLMADHINLQGVNPLTGSNDDKIGPRFPDMTEAYSLRLRKIASQAALGLGKTLQEGVYAALLGPSYETPAEIRYLRTIGADLVGMSTAAEAIAANHAGMEVLGISCVTNVAAGLGEGKLDHQEVLDVGKSSAAFFTSLLSKLIPELGKL